jgi:hypothetical protein
MTVPLERDGMGMTEQEAGMAFTIFGMSGFIFQVRRKN